MPMSLVGELVSIGTLLAFVLVCVGAPLLRVANPGIRRPLEGPGGMAARGSSAFQGALACLLQVMSGLADRHLAAPHRLDGGGPDHLRGIRLAPEPLPTRARPRHGRRFTGRSWRSP